MLSRFGVDGTDFVLGLSYDFDFRRKSDRILHVKGPCRHAQSTEMKHPAYGPMG